jgi:hypothetical protein
METNKLTIAGQFVRPKEAGSDIGDVHLGTEPAKRVDQNHPVNIKHDHLSPVANARQSMILIL